MFERSSLNGDKVMTVGKNDTDDVDHNDDVDFSEKDDDVLQVSEVAHSYTKFLFIWIGK